VGGLYQALQFVGCNHGDITTRATTHYDDLAVCDGTIHKRLELLAGLAVGGFDGHRFPRGRGFEIEGYCT
jgi:hypothetical protein